MSLVKSTLIVTAIAIGLELAGSGGAGSTPDRGALLVDVAAVRAAPSSAARAPSAREATPAEHAQRASACCAHRRGPWPM